MEKIKNGIKKFADTVEDICEDHGKTIITFSTVGGILAIVLRNFKYMADLTKLAKK